MRNTDYSDILKQPPETIRKRQWTKGWALSFVGLIVYGVLHLFRCKPLDYYGICKYFEIGKNWGGLEMGWFFICGKDSSERLKNHEVGHAIQNATFGGLRMLMLSTGSVFRYWWRKISGAKTSYDSWWFEGQATKLGTQYVNSIKSNSIKNYNRRIPK